MSTSRQLLMIVIFGLLAACSTPSISVTPPPAAIPTTQVSPSPTPESTAIPPSFVVLSSDLTDSIFTRLNQSIKESSGQIGYSIKTYKINNVSDSEINKFSDQNVKAIILYSPPNTNSIEIIQKAEQQKIPIFIIGENTSGIKPISLIQPDPLSGAEQAAKLTCRAIRNRGEVVILDDQSNTNKETVDKAFEKSLANSCPEVNIIAHQAISSYEGAGQAINKLLLTNPDLSAIFSQNEPAILGSAAAVQAAGRPGITLIGFGESDKAIQALRADIITGLVMPDPLQTGKVVVDTIKKFINGQPFADVTLAPMKISPSDFSLTLPPDTTAKKLNVALLFPTMESDYYQAVYRGFKTTARSTDGLKLLVFNAQGDAGKMKAEIERQVNKHVDALIISPVDPTSTINTLQKINKSEIPVFIFDRQIPGSKAISQIYPDSLSGGFQAAEFLCKSLQKNGKVVELQGKASDPQSQAISKGFEMYMKDSCQGILMPIRKYAPLSTSESQMIFADILKSLPDINGVFAYNDEVALGAIQAAEKAGRSNIIFIGYGDTEAGREAIREGKMTATMGQYSSELGQITMETALEYLYGRKVDPDKPFPLKVVTKKDIE